MSDELKPNDKQQDIPEDLYRRLALLEAYNRIPDDDEVDMGNLLLTIWNGRKYLFLSVGIISLIGLFIAFGSSEEFTAEVKLMPETNQGSGVGGLGSLARHFGVSSSQPPSEGIPSDLYPDITQSLVLMNRLMEYEVQLADHDEPVTLFDYFRHHQRTSAVSFVQKYTFGLPVTMVRAVNRRIGGNNNPAPDISNSWMMNEAKADRILRMSDEEWEVIRNIRNRISTNMFQETGIVAVSIKMPEPELAADVADQIVEFLMEYVTNYRTEKARNDVEFIEERYAEARSRFEAAQEQMARFNDENRGQLTAMARTQEQRLQSEYNLTFNLYNSMAERLEEARIKLQDETPVVNILEPAAVPDRRSEPNRGFIMLLSLMLGGMLGIGYIFGLNRWESFKQKASVTE